MCRNERTDNHAELRGTSFPWHWFTGNTDLIIGTVLYAITAYLDASYTVYGITAGAFQEGNPIPRFFMNLLGIREGLIFVKCSVCIFLLLVCGSIGRKKAPDRSIRCLPFYIISLFQVLAAAAWIFCLSVHPLANRDMAFP